MYKSRKDNYNKIYDNINIILVSPQVPENIGLCARTLKNTSFKNLYLVKPNLTSKSFEVAKRARDILENAKIFNSYEEALKDSSLVLGTTRRKRKDAWTYSLQDIITNIVLMSMNNKISIVFGRENFGLFKEECDLCDYLINIEGNPYFPSYNLSLSVGIVCYELYVHINKLFNPPYDNIKPASKKDLFSMFSFIKDGLEKLEFSKDMVETLTSSLQRLFKKTFLSRNEVQVIKSIFLKIAERKK